MTERPGGTYSVEQMMDYRIVGAAYYRTGVHTFAEWSAKMMKACGEGVRPHLEALWERTHGKDVGEDACLPSRQSERDLPGANNTSAAELPNTRLPDAMSTEKYLCWVKIGVIASKATGRFGRHSFEEWAAELQELLQAQYGNLDILKDVDLVWVYAGVRKRIREEWPAYVSALRAKAANNVSAAEGHERLELPEGGSTGDVQPQSGRTSTGLSAEDWDKVVATAHQMAAEDQELKDLEIRRRQERELFQRAIEEWGAKLSAVPPKTGAIGGVANWRWYWKVLLGLALVAGIGAVLWVGRWRYTVYSYEGSTHFYRTNRYTGRVEKYAPSVPGWMKYDRSR